ncbi:MAG: hypothetical protein B7Y45_10170 [Sphingomonas sp. 28-66-16]|nr:MAG: hypothetical protein B7Y45_10170 [Sphingomonas sp. 28-66-16]
MLRTIVVSAALCATEAQAQQRPEAPGDRTGPGATAPTLPAFSRPAPALVPPIDAPAATVPAVDDAGIVIADVDVAGGPGSAPAAADWAPTPDPVTGLTLEQPPSRGFDAAWVKHQFALNGLIGARMPLDRTTALIQLINLAFVRNGYINSGVRITGGALVDGGVLHLVLVFGRLTADGDASPVIVRWGAGGARGLTSGFVTDRMQAAREVPLNALSIERAFRLLSENPAIATVRADLRPGARPGEATLALTVDPAPRIDLYASVANSRSPAVGAQRGAIGGSIRNLITAGDLASAEAGITAGQPDASASYQTPIFGTRTNFLMRGGYNLASVVDRPLVPLDISARDWNVEAGLDQTLVLRPLTPRPAGGWRAARSISVGVRLAHRETATFLLGQPFSFSPGAVDGRSDYTALRLVGDWVERGISQVTALSVTFTQGLAGSRVIPTNPVDAAALLDRVPTTDFRALLVQASHARRLTSDGLEVRLRLTGQWAEGLLYSGERLAAGGDATVRGYRETLALVDRGLIGSVELYQPVSLSGRGADAHGVNLAAFGVSAFVDGAVLGNARDPQPRPDRLASVGAGLAWVPADAITARVSYAYALIDAPQVGSRDLQDRGFQFRVTLHPLALLRRR